jgi:hypothetical protein
MPTKTKPAKRHPDPAGVAWHAEAAARWEASGGEIDRYDAPPLPAWSAPAHVRRELFGRYLLDRDANVVHDTAHALPACGVDAIRNGTFVHFASELAAALPADAIDCTCMGGVA